MNVIFLIVRNNLYQYWFKDIIMINLLNDIIENLYLIKNNEQITMLELSKKIRRYIKI